MLSPNLHADVMQDYQALQAQWDTIAIDELGEQEASPQIAPATLDRLIKASELESSKQFWKESLSLPGGRIERLEWLGRVRGKAEHILAMEMLAALKSGQVEHALQWRVLLKLPKYAETVDGTLAIHRVGHVKSQRTQVTKLLTREYMLWQSTRIREKSGGLSRLISKDRNTPELLALRSSEIQALTDFPPTMLETVEVPLASNPSTEAYDRWHAAGAVAENIEPWIEAVLGGIPNLLTPEEAARRESLLVKLLRLIPVEYSAGVKDGEILIPIEYREAESFTINAGEIVSELQAVWRKERTDALAAHGTTLQSGIEELEASIQTLADPREIEDKAGELSSLLSNEFGISLRKAGTAGEVVEEAVMEVKSLLGESLQAALAGNRSKAESLRLEAYTTFDLELEARVLPRDPNLALEAEQRFLDGTPERPGIKATLDTRGSAEELHLAYESAIEGVDQCKSILQLGLSPMTATFSTVSIVLREGLEAVVILAALLAGLRGRTTEKTRKGIVRGVWLALFCTALTFVVSRYVVVSLSRFGERLEATVSILAVIVLLIVTNWVAHKYYWAGWNARLRELGRAAVSRKDSRWEWLALIGVGFVTVYREGFETVLFLQTLLLEGGLKPVLLGIGIGGTAIVSLGWLVFKVGMKLPYRKMLVVTGFLVVSILATFLGSTVRLFQTVGWLPIHPIRSLDLPPWMGTWFGVYPSWEGMIIPIGGLFYVAGAWLWVKWSTRRKATRIENKTVPAGQAARGTVEAV